ncbi:hypothetical protein CRYUN_Cryun26dG0066900 [Craigia yunnanensis]
MGSECLGANLKFELAADGTTWQQTTTGPCKIDANYPNACLEQKLSKCRKGSELFVPTRGCLWIKGPSFIQNENFDVVYIIKLGNSKEVFLNSFKLNLQDKGKQAKTRLPEIKSELSPFYNLKRSEKKSQASQLFNFSQIVDATDNFSFTNRLGEGGFGPVYKGTLLDGQPVAVKRLARNFGQGLEEFMNEITLIADLQHMNLVRLLGCCIQEEEKMIVYEYMFNKSLDTFLFDPAKRNCWIGKNALPSLKEYHKGLGLLYLHRYSILSLKASNILGHNESTANTNKWLYVPRVCMNGIFSMKTDVFSFRVLLLEVVSGKKNTLLRSSSNPASLIHHAWDLWKQGDVRELKDELLESCPNNELLSCIQVALLCVQASAADRPTMSDIISSLRNDVIFLQEPKEPAYTTKSETRKVETPSSKVSLRDDEAEYKNGFYLCNSRWSLRSLKNNYQANSFLGLGLDLGSSLFIPHANLDED